MVDLIKYIYSGTDQRKKSKLRVTGLCAGNSLVACEFPAQMSSDTENVAIWLRRHSSCPSIPTMAPC